MKKISNYLYVDLQELDIYKKTTLIISIMIVVLAVGDYIILRKKTSRTKYL